MHDGEHREEELRRYEYPGDLPHQDAVKGLGHNEAAVQVTDLEEAVESRLVLGLRVGDLSLSLAFPEPVAEIALRLQIYPSLSATQWNWTRARAD